MKTLICHGDSLTEASDPDNPSIWPSLVEDRLKIKVLNSGIGGDTTAGQLSRFYHDVVGHRPDYVLIMGGTNDLWWDLDVKLIQANIFTMTCQAEYHNIVPLVGLATPMVVERARNQDFMAPQGGYKRCMEKLAVLVRNLTILAQQNEIACLDFYHLFCDASGAVQEKYFLEDGLHPNKAGHRLMAKKTVELLQCRFNFS
ncbi:MAG: GDSL-type esterase/lipase family protein [Desulfobacterales bacterium]|jgi:lysophospholipase L1-like esterase